MLRHSNRRAPALTIAGGSLLTFAIGLVAFPQLAAAWPVGQEATVTLDNFTAQQKDGGVITIKHAEFQGTNLSKEEIEKLLTPDTPVDDETALLQKAKFGAVSIPLIEI